MLISDIKRYIQTDLKTALNKIKVIFQPENDEVVFQIIFFKHLPIKNVALFNIINYNILIIVKVKSKMIFKTSEFLPTSKC